MSGKKIINLLKTFSRQERLLFEKWLKSPFFNENQLLLVLFEQLQAVIDETCELDKMSIWKALFDTLPFEDTTLRRTFSSLLNQAYQFLSIRQYQSQTIKQKIDLLPLLIAPELSTHHAGILRNVEQNLYTDISDHADLYMQYSSVIVSSRMDAICGESVGIHVKGT